jgi:monoamine oxidase
MKAFSEAVLDSLDFDFTEDQTWRCILGGTEQVAERMRDQIKRQVPGFDVKYQSAVTGIKFDDQRDHLYVKVGDKWQSESYDVVFNSVPLGVMGRMDLRSLDLPYGVKQAIRSLQYGPATKVGIKFSQMWWLDEDQGIIQGGTGTTDLPIRVCVYPSYNIYDGAKNPGVLLCSYAWDQDADRLGSFITNAHPTSDSTGGDELKNLLIYNLAVLHSDDSSFNRVHETIKDSYESHFAWDWHQDPNTAGAYALFGPSQFSQMYPDLVRGSKHVIIGEAASTHHAWIVGALESAVRGVYNFLYERSLTSKACHDALQLYDNPPKDPSKRLFSPFWPLPPQYDQRPDIAGPTKRFDGGAIDEKISGNLAKHLVLLNDPKRALRYLNHANA